MTGRIGLIFGIQIDGCIFHINTTGYLLFYQYRLSMSSQRLLGRSFCLRNIDEVNANYFHRIPAKYCNCIFIQTLDQRH